MTIKEIAEITSALIKRDDINEYLVSNTNSSGYSNTEKDLNIIVRCINLVINELAVNYLPFIKKEQIVSSNGIIEYQDLSENILEVISVYDECDNKINYTLDKTHIKTKPTKVFVEYSYLPESYKINDELIIGNNKVTAFLLSEGVASEYLLISNEYEESLTYFNKYKCGLEKIFLPKNFQLKKRSFL